MDKVFDDDYEFPGLGKPARCRLRVYREDPWKGVIAVATEISTNPGASITNAIENLAAQVWRDFIPASGWPPVLFDHYETASYDPPGHTGDEFSFVTFHQHHGDKGIVGHPDWRWWPGSMVRRLVDDQQLGDGFDRKLDPADPGTDWTEQEVEG
jgi:hypothetical protein